MSRIPPLQPDDLPEFAGLWQLAEATVGFTPRSLYAMAHLPEMLRACIQLNASIFLGGELDPALKQLCAYMSSLSAGCRYCQAHTAAHAAHLGVSREKIDALWEFETSAAFDAAERAALRLAVAGGKSPAQATDAHFAELRKYYTDSQTAELVAAIAFFGFLNRWNDILATPLEDVPLQFAREHLATQGWEPGAHAPEPPR